MRKTLFVVATLALVLTGCGSATYDNSEVLAEIASLREDMNNGFTETNNRIDQIETTAPSETASVDTETASEEETVSTEVEATSEETAESTESETVPAKAPTKQAHELQVSVIHCENRIPVKLVEGKVSEDCMKNPTDLNSPTGTHRDLHFLFVGEKIKEAYWIYGASQEQNRELSPSTGDDGFSYLYFNMEEGNGIYNFMVVTESGKVYSFSLKYYYDNII